MRMFIALFVKEVKDVRGAFCAFAIGTLVLQGWVLLAVENQTIGIFLSWLPVWGVLFVSPFMLASSFKGEWRGNTNHLLFALPVRTGLTALCKCAAMLSFGLALIAIAGTGIYLVAQRETQSVLFQLMNQVEVTPAGVFETAMGFIASCLVLSLGVVTAMEGVKFSAARLRGLAAAASLVISAFIYLTLAGDFMNAAQGYLSSAAALMVYTLLVGLVFLLIGMFLFEKFVEI